MSMEQLMALVPIEAATSKAIGGRKSRWERSSSSVKQNGSTKRWGNPSDKPFLPPPFVDLPPGLTPLQVDQFLKEQRLDELSVKLRVGELEFGDPDIRPPSPPPSYDKTGNRTNTREIRVRNAMSSEYQRLIEFMSTTVAGFVAPADYKPEKKVRRIVIPQEQYPEYNFMGLIIGPRGCNHKRLEAESGCQISIRGKGTQKEGKKTDHQTEEEAQMPQHVHIASESDDKLERAASLIEPLLDPFHPLHEEFKKKGLEQLALVNGVQITKADTRCSVCGALGHLSWECPDQQFQSFTKVDVKCLLCGDRGHVTLDCKLARNATPEQLAQVELQVNSHAAPAPSSGGAGVIPPPPPPAKVPTRAEQAEMEREYAQMMSELTGSKSGGSSAASPLSVNNKSSEGLGATGGNSTPPPGLPSPILPNAVPSSGAMAAIPPPPPSDHISTQSSSYGGVYRGSMQQQQVDMNNMLMQQAGMMVMPNMMGGMMPMMPNPSMMAGMMPGGVMPHVGMIGTGVNAMGSFGSTAGKTMSAPNSASTNAASNGVTNPSTGFPSLSTLNPIDISSAAANAAAMSGSLQQFLNIPGSASMAALWSMMNFPNPMINGNTATAPQPSNQQFTPLNMYNNQQLFSQVKAPSTGPEEPPPPEDDESSPPPPCPPSSGQIDAPLSGEGEDIPPWQQKAVNGNVGANKYQGDNPYTQNPYWP